MNKVAVTINLPTTGARQDYLHCVSSALTAAQARGDTVSAMALAGLLTLVDEALNQRNYGRWIGMDFGREPGFTV